eukprot:TRINITY_DN64785_c0_g1_i1.p1 TRINITY_DN64785_c0_g1~~TRINITY_DN64785_c0_g1_i1.p1  ORF type:complete len:558 (+),score=175.05 TRINITY_DN64785_c0_g1_i1:73-1674(+)
MSGFGSVAVLGSAQPGGAPDRKRSKKERKKEKKRARKEKKHKKRQRSSSESSESGSEAPAPAPAARPQSAAAGGGAAWATAGGEGSAGDFMQLLLGGDGGGAEGTRSRVEAALRERHGDGAERRPRPAPRDAQELLADGLRSRFSAASSKSREIDGMDNALNMPPPPVQAVDEGAPVAVLLDADGCWDGQFVPEHLRQTPVGEMRAMLGRIGRQTRGRAAKRQRAAADDGLDVTVLLKRERSGAFSGVQQREQRTAQRGCAVSYGSERFSRENLVSLGERFMLMLPVHGALAAGHCYLVPIERRGCELELDADEARELRNFKKCLLQMWHEQGSDGVFCELVLDPRSREQMVIECFPVPADRATDAEISFWKALDEAEGEFVQQHKRVIKTRGKPLAQCLARQVPYFHVAFGLEGGFAHVIAEPGRFPRDFARQVCGGVLDLGMRGRLSKQGNAALLGHEARRAFRERWDPHDWTKALDGGGSDGDQEPAPAEAPAAPRPAPPLPAPRAAMPAHGAAGSLPARGAAGEIDIGL